MLAGMCRRGLWAPGVALVWLVVTACGGGGGTTERSVSGTVMPPPANPTATAATQTITVAKLLRPTTRVLDNTNSQVLNTGTVGASNTYGVPHLPVNEPLACETTLLETATSRTFNLGCLIAGGAADAVKNITGKSHLALVAALQMIANGLLDPANINQALIDVLETAAQTPAQTVDFTDVDAVNEAAAQVATNSQPVGRYTGTWNADAVNPPQSGTLSMDLTLISTSPNVIYQATGEVVLVSGGINLPHGGTGQIVDSNGTIQTTINGQTYRFVGQLVVNGGVGTLAGNIEAGDGLGGFVRVGTFTMTERP